MIASDEETLLNTKPNDDINDQVLNELQIPWFSESVCDLIFQESSSALLQFTNVENSLWLLFPF